MNELFENGIQQILNLNCNVRVKKNSKAEKGIIIFQKHNSKFSLQYILRKFLDERTCYKAEELKEKKILVIFFEKTKIFL